MFLGKKKLASVLQKPWKLYISLNLVFKNITPLKRFALVGERKPLKLKTESVCFDWISRPHGTAYIPNNWVYYSGDDGLTNGVRLLRYSWIWIFCGECHTLWFYKKDVWGRNAWRTPKNVCVGGYIEYFAKSVFGTLMFGEPFRGNPVLNAKPQIRYCDKESTLSQVSMM